MDILQKLGGRKFIMAMVLVGVGLLIEVKTDRGMSPTFAGLLAGIYATFSAANFGVSKEHLKTKSSASPETSSDEKLDALLERTNPEKDEQAVQQIVELLQGVNANLNDVKNTTLTVGQAVVNLGSEVGRVKKAITG